MAACKEKSLSVESPCISQSFKGDNKSVKGEKIQIQEQSSTEKPKINKLKRAKRSKKFDLMLNECNVIKPDDDDDQKCSHTYTMKNPRPPTTHSAQCSPPKRGLLLHMKMSRRQNKGLEIKSESTTSHRQPAILADEVRSLSRGGSCAERSGLHEHQEQESENNTNNSKSTPGSPGHRVKSSTGFFKDSHTREEFLKLVQVQNPRFPVRRSFQTLLKRHGESKSVPAAGKRKHEVESDGDGRLCKRRCPSRDDSETVNRSEGPVSSGHGVISRNMSHQDEGGVRHDDDYVPWTEKYRPRSSDEVVGNSAAVRKLYSWLKEWRIRADVEERRKRREERRMKEESNGSWDCGDFEGDPLTEECEGKLCNTLLIHGPTGAGKSAAVFACVEQLGFKVLEVNSSSLRSGRLVLSQLRESTQSHQVETPQRSISHTHTPAAASHTILISRNIVPPKHL